jgi:hypothetical protein
MLTPPATSILLALLSVIEVIVISVALTWIASAALDLKAVWNLGVAASVAVIPDII